ncbi:hypothetical protein M409DRAFT_50371 [Zasmidium cellare ATCC 36951]|uniref:Uncharacterized protein n=1 Tax=Zasmidium cellare ATCC 36951 TaxID=1080233 RepID=A0A6A6CYC1_ZASCE|nr:uncharacterized protein M409DRAFT_50371 [Zasmidium cellare ATCC 36951]KAF2171713.1 hypothetical protein M409DRAFT_50371 [Zasmidium cellare ATCC 36951]
MKPFPAHEPHVRIGNCVARGPSNEPCLAPLRAPLAWRRGVEGVIEECCQFGFRAVESQTPPEFPRVRGAPPAGLDSFLAAGQTTPSSTVVLLYACPSTTHPYRSTGQGDQPHLATTPPVRDCIPGLQSSISRPLGAKHTREILAIWSIPPAILAASGVIFRGENDQSGGDTCECNDGDGVGAVTITTVIKGLHHVRITLPMNGHLSVPHKDQGSKAGFPNRSQIVFFTSAGSSKDPAACVQTRQSEIKATTNTAV